MGISDYSATEVENTTVPGTPPIEIGKGNLSPQGHDIQRQALQRIMADMKAFSARANGRKNWLINGDGRINQRAASTGISDDEYAHDRHYALTQSGDISVSTLTAPAGGIGHMMRLTQANAGAQRFGYAQIIEAAETYALRGRVVTLGGQLRHSAAAPLRFAILEWTGTADSVTSDVVNDWTSGTYAAGSFFKSSGLTITQVGALTPAAATMADFHLTATIGAGANNIIVLIWTEGASAQNETLDLRWYLCEGDLTGATDFPDVDVAGEMVRCFRFYYAYTISTGAYGLVMGGRSTSVCSGTLPFPTVMRIAPSFGIAGTPGLLGVATENLDSMTCFASSQVAGINWSDTGGPLANLSVYGLTGVSGDVVLEFNSEL
ncbi:MAG: hypothetical protein AB7O39_01055 [Flavobacteriaceae bacterium]